MNYLIQRTLENRGYTDDFLREINVSTYDELKDIDTMAVRLKEIHDEQLVITIYPDFDMDGIAAGTCGFAGLSELGFKVNLYVPNPSEGYGVSAKSVSDLMQRFPDTKVIITCDTGITASEAADYCRKQGIELLITDHHNQKVVIDADIIVNPMRLDETYSHPKICGAFVFYQLLQYYADLYGNYYMQDQIRRLRVFAGIGTISDTMPLLYENRQLVKDAVMITRLIYGDGSPDSIINVQGSDVYRRAFWGLYQATKVCEAYGVIKSAKDIDEDFFGFYLAPMFNAGKRMEGDMNRIFGVFFANDSYQHMDYVYNLNIERKQLVEIEYNKMINDTQPYAPYIYISDAKPGILGLLAMKVMNQTGVPAFVLHDEGENCTTGNRYHGSGRAPEWFAVNERLIDGISIDGHDAAFGCGIGNKTTLERFFKILEKEVPEAFDKAEIIEVVPDFVIATDWSADTGIDVSLFDEYLNEIENYRPFGKDFPAPYVEFKFRNNDVVEWKVMGKAHQHLKLSFMQGFDVICWNQAHLISQKDSFDTHTVFGHLGRSEYKGVMSVNFIGDFVEQ